MPGFLTQEVRREAEIAVQVENEQVPTEQPIQLYRSYLAYNELFTIRQIPSKIIDKFFGRHALSRKKYTEI